MVYFDDANAPISPLIISFSVWTGFEISTVSTAAPPMMSSSAGCISTSMLPCSIR